MDINAYLNMFMMLALVVGIIYGMAYLLKRVKSPIFGNREGLRLKIIENLPIDAKRRIILVAKDNTELLILLSPTGDIVVDTTNDVRHGHQGEPPKIARKTKTNLFKTILEKTE